MSYSLDQISGSSGMHAVSGASAPMPPSQKMSILFDSIDTSGSGTITKSQLESAFSSQQPTRGFKAAGADAIWNQLDPSGSGSITKQQFVQGMTSLMSHFRNGGSVSNLSSSTSTSSTLNAGIQSLGSSTGSLNVSA